MKINSRVWRRFLRKLGSGLLATTLFIGYLLSLWFVGGYLSLQLGYDTVLTMFVVSIAGVFVPLICWILYGEYKLTKTEIEIEDRLVMMSLKKGVGGFDDRGI